MQDIYKNRNRYSECKMLIFVNKLLKEKTQDIRKKKKKN